MSEGLKHDAGKLDWSTLDLEFIEPLVEATGSGAGEYGFMNYLEPFENADRRFWAATMRHLKDCQRDPLARDEKSGCYHLASVAFNALMRLYHARKEEERLKHNVMEKVNDALKVWSGEVDIAIRLVNDEDENVSSRIQTGL